MTAPTLPVRQERDAGLRRVPWRRMAWVTWRQHRITLAGVAALLGALAVYLWLTGLQVHHAYAAAAACHPAFSPVCQNVLSAAHNTDATAHETAALLQVVPALIGAFTGAPVLARELETGTFRYAWTQGMGRWRWTVAKLVLLAVTVAAAAGAFGVLFSWYFSPIVASGDETTFLSTVFDLAGVALAAWTLVAFAIGALAGMLIRRVVPAIAATLAAWSGLAITTAAVLRQHYMTPRVSSSPSLQDSAWIISQWYTRGGKPVSQSVISQVLEGDPLRHVGPHAILYAINPPQYLAQHGFSSWMSYQPASRFWTFQWIEGGWLLALSALLIAAAIWLVRRRAA
jgi:ABC-type transport system involved in multi-copper enzyme maturation permease subunit